MGARSSRCSQCFEHWFGPYPWYRDGYQLIESPHLGMEHQSAVAYGNGYRNGYKGTDLSGTGWGLTWDFIVIHESAHEWWGNSLTTADMADMWVHESFANYSESLFTECRYGTAAGAEYVRGTRKLVKNDKPIVGTYGVNSDGSGDMYYKGGNMLHTIRQVVGNDSLWRATCVGSTAKFAHQIVTGRQVQDYISATSGIDLGKVFEQYLTTTKIPVFEYRLDGTSLVVPLGGRRARVRDAGPRGRGAGQQVRLAPTEHWQTGDAALDGPESFHVDENFFVKPRRVARQTAAVRDRQ